jgi:hypothetical protein
LDAWAEGFHCGDKGGPGRLEEEGWAFADAGGVAWACAEADVVGGSDDCEGG